MPAPKNVQPAISKNESLFSFIPPGMLRSIAEYLVAFIPGAILLFAFFIAAQVAVVFMDGTFLSIVFIPVICIVPALSGVISALTLEKVRDKSLTIKRGALVGAGASFFGAVFASIAIALICYFTRKFPFGFDSMLWLGGAFVAIVAVDAMLGGLGGALVAKFIKED